MNNKKNRIKARCLNSFSIPYFSFYNILHKSCLKFSWIYVILKNFAENFTETFASWHIHIPILRYSFIDNNFDIAGEIKWVSLSISELNE